MACGERLKWCYVISCTAFIASSGLLNGYDMGSSNGVKEMDGFRVYFNLSRDQDDNTTSCGGSDDDQTSALLGMVVSAFSLGSLLGGLLGGPLSDWGGRRTAMVCGLFLCATGIIVQSASVFIWMLLVGKVWTGLGNGMLVQVGLYIAELSPKHLRGKLVSMLSTAATTGVLISSLVNLGVERLAFGWRVSLGVQFIVATSLIIGSPLIPESPRWHVKKNKRDKAAKTLKKIYKEDKIVSERLEEISTSFKQSKTDKKLWKVWLSWDTLHRLFIGFCVLFFGRISGTQLALYFSVGIFCKVGISGFVGGVIIGLSTLLSQLSLLLIADRFGRKIILLCGYLVMGGCLLAASVLIFAFDLQSEQASTENTVAGYFVVIFLALFVGVAMMTAVSHGWIISSEIFPLRIKGVATSVVTIGFWSGNILSGEVAPFLLSSLGTAWTLVLHAGICAVAFIFVLLLLPETKQLTLEQVDRLFSAPWLQRTNVLFYLTCGKINRTVDTNSFSHLEDLQPSLESDSEDEAADSAPNSPADVIPLLEQGGENNGQLEVQSESSL